METFSRVKLLIGQEKLNKIQSSSVAVFGIGGVGGFVAESLIRSGVCKLDLFDSDKVSMSNLNRQIVATVDTVGKDKVDAMKSRLLSINPNATIKVNKVFYLPENADDIDLTKYDYIVDAIDTVSAKIELISRAKKFNVPIISCMGTGGKTDPQMLKVADIEKTRGCPLARVMRRELKLRNIRDVKVVYSEEQTIIDQGQKINAEKTNSGRIVPPSMIFVPACAGILIAREVVFDIANGIDGEKK